MNYPKNVTHAGVFFILCDVLYWQAKTFRKKSLFINDLNSHPNRSSYSFVMEAIVWRVYREAEKMQHLRVNIAMLYNASILSSQ